MTSAVEKKCPWCGHTPQLTDARKLVGLESEIEFSEKYPFVVRCDNPMCDVQPRTQGAATEDMAIYQWDTMQSADIIGLEGGDD